MKKQKAYLTVEATLIILILFSVASVLFSLAIIINKNMELYNYVDQSSRNVAQFFYAGSRLQAAISENGQVMGSGQSYLSSLLTSGMATNFENLSTAVAASLIASDVERNLASHSRSWSSLWLTGKPTIAVSLADNALLVETSQNYGFRGLKFFNSQLSLNDRHIIALKGARSLISGSERLSNGQVYLTNHGKTKTFVYHTSRHCMGFRRVKTYFTHSVDKSQLGKNITIEGKTYHHCPFCASGK